MRRRVAGTARGSHGRGRKTAERGDHAVLPEPGEAPDGAGVDHAGETGRVTLAGGPAAAGNLLVRPILAVVEDRDGAGGLGEGIGGAGEVKTNGQDVLEVPVVGPGGWGHAGRGSWPGELVEPGPAG